MRIIPTRMGTRILNLIRNKYKRDHPHAYGDKIFDCRTKAEWEGSSPRVWGQEITYGQSSSNIRIIPTRMGTSAEVDLSMFDFEDHPHAYGDKSNASPESCTAAGSSPRVWGQVTHGSFCRHSNRIIPTRMGTSKGLDKAINWTEDHPHAYGDKLI